MTATPYSVEQADREDMAYDFARRVWDLNNGYQNAGMYFEEAYVQQRLQAEKDRAGYISNEDARALSDALTIVWSEEREKRRAALLDTQQRLHTPGRMIA